MFRIGFCLEHLDAPVEVLEVDLHELEFLDLGRQFAHTVAHALELLHHFLLFLHAHTGRFEGLLEALHLRLELMVFRGGGTLGVLVASAALDLGDELLELVLDGVSPLAVKVHFSTDGLDFSDQQVDRFSVLLVLGLNRVALVP